MKTLYICGDSFSTVDIEYGPCWVNFLIDKLPHIKIINLSIPGASNYLIQLQVKQALLEKCDYLIYHATSSIRQEFSVNHRKIDIGLDTLDRYWTPTDRDNKSAISRSWVSASENANGIIDDTSNLEISNFFTSYIDFSSEIGENFIFIDYTLQMISTNQQLINWCWSQGGFEHTNFKNSVAWDFSQYRNKESQINLWDKYDRQLIRPFYHITDIQVHQKTCDYYIKMLNLNNV